MKEYLQPLAELLNCAEDDLIRTSGLDLTPNGSNPDMEGEW